MKKTTTDFKRSKVDLTQSREDLKQLLLKLPEEKVAERFSDDKLDREHEKARLKDSASPTGLIGRHLLAIEPQVYAPIFPKDYYRQIFRLNGWPIPDGDISEKPHIVAKWTNEIIYLRFTRAILDELRQKNPLMVGRWLREHKHHQWLTDQGRIFLEGFI